MDKRAVKDAERLNQERNAFPRRGSCTSSDAFGEINSDAVTGIALPTPMGFPFMMARVDPWAKDDFFVRTIAIRSNGFAQFAKSIGRRERGESAFKASS